MNRKRRTRILIDFGKIEILWMAEMIEKSYSIEMISEPSEALTMIKMRESAKNTLFYVGEVLITESKVRINGKVGIGIVKGHEAILSRALAVIDAALSAELPETAAWLSVLEDLERSGEEAIERKQRSLAKTKVNFETMNQ